MKRDKSCDTSICKFLKGLEAGTIIQFAIDNTDEFFENERFTFLCFDAKNCCVTLERIQENNIVYVDCRAIVGVQVERNNSGGEIG